MSGIDVGMLDSIINRVDSEYQPLSKDSKKLINALDEFYNFNSSGTMEYLSSNFAEVKEEIYNMLQVVSSYLETLRNVKKSYVKQDTIFSEQLEHIVSMYR